MKRYTLEEFQELECKARNIGPFMYLRLHKRRDITIMAWKKFHEQEIECLKSQIPERISDLEIVEDLDWESEMLEALGELKKHNYTQDELISHVFVAGLKSMQNRLLPLNK